MRFPRSTYAYSLALQIVTRTETLDAYAYTGDENVSRGYQVNGLNQYTQTLVGGGVAASFEHDSNGNLRTSATTGPSGSTTNYVYDAENRLVSASGGASAQLVYDPLGRLFQTSGGSAGVRQFLYDGDALVAEYDSGGNVVKRYVHGRGVDDPVAMYDGPDIGFANRRYHKPDERGSIVAMLNADGSIRRIDNYDPWGVPSTTSLERFAYTGQIYLPELGMYHYKARIYSPILGRFLQTDPIGYKDQVNLYAYAANDPTNRWDPSGKAVYGPQDREQRRLVERLINARASGGGYRYTFRGKDNQLQRQKESGSRGMTTGTRIGSSSYYSRRLNEAIASDRRTDIRVQNTIQNEKNETVNIDQAYGGGVTVPENGGNATVYITGNAVRQALGDTGKPILYGPAEILAHELLGHAIPRTVGTDTGNAVANENKMRREAGIPTRAAEPNHVEWPD